MIIFQTVKQQLSANELCLEHAGELRLASDGRLVGIIVIGKGVTTIELPLLGNNWQRHFDNMGLKFGASDIPTIIEFDDVVRGFSTRLVIALPHGVPISRLGSGLEKKTTHLSSLVTPVSRYDTDLSWRLSLTLASLKDAEREVRQ
ncbi:hypothetical protein ACFSJ3_10590 [Corallincola platygyrae]|uniref:MutS-like protein n=1 Tax=Corallincola platygyrae TaxID=1193278 RepID=A0ABW4XMI0_9GAMM